MSASINNRIARVVSDVLGIPSDEVIDDSSPDTIATWDSLSHLNIVLALESEFNVSFSPEEIVEMLSVGLIRVTLSEHGLSDST